ncbi:hypothetical protein [Methylobacterium oryzisoli]|uniref:hypothetical protein n=1 Tax=Methylobacterium oryzisoli TaxID=3385502 RepID=UPI0038914D51
MTSDEAEKAIRFLCNQWAAEQSRQSPTEDHGDYSEFRSWLAKNGHEKYLQFESPIGAEREAETWFDQEMYQTSLRLK